MNKIIYAILVFVIINTGFIGYHIYKTQFDLGCITDTECENNE